MPQNFEHTPPTLVSGVYETYESNVRVYCRHFPTEFTRAQNSFLWDKNNTRYIDFIMAAGSLNYGHNNPLLKQHLIDYIQNDGITTSLDLHTHAKNDFISNFQNLILKPRNLSYKIQFTGPTGTNAVEAALKVARKTTGRRTVVAFTNAFHGMSLGALAASGNKKSRAGATCSLNDVFRVPYYGYMGENVDTLDYLERLLKDPSSGLDLPAAILLETIQGEGGVNIANKDWLQRLASLARRYDILLIVDDIQAGCGRSGDFFSFEAAGLHPDLVCLSKSLSGYGLPLSVLLIKPELDQQSPGEHNGTFRGNNPAFVTAAKACELWGDDNFTSNLRNRQDQFGEWAVKFSERYQHRGVTVRHRGMIMGIDLPQPNEIDKIQYNAFRAGLMFETCGPNDNVIKIMPALTVEAHTLHTGMEILEKCLDEALHP